MLKKQTIGTTIHKSVIKNARIAIIKTDYYIELNSNLEKACRKTLVHYGLSAEHITTFTAPGSWEIPLIAQTVAKTKKYDAIVAFGVIIKGDTYHFDMIANECTRALMQLSLDYSIPVAIEVLAVLIIVQNELRIAAAMRVDGGIKLVSKLTR